MLQTNGSSKTYAVVVGIAGYREKDIPQLRFANRDAEEFAGFLRSPAGGSVPEENITLLVDSQATTGAVYDALYQLSKTAAKGDLVYFYFSGHGDLENATIYKNGFLICYDSPPVNYVKNSLSIDYLNEIANTLSAQTEANVVLITDACHSGKLAGSRNKGNFLVGDQLRRVMKKEIRITSCAENQLSNENEAWGGGRGVFSWYLINGLKGLADRQKDGIVTLDEIKNYLDSSLLKDPVLTRENLVQTPVLKGNGSFLLAKTDTDIAGKANEEMKLGLAMMQSAPPVTVNEEKIPADGRKYFFELVKKRRLEILTDTAFLDELPEAELPFAIINRIAAGLVSQAGIRKLEELRSALQADPAMLKKFSSKLAVAFDETGQQVINQYLLGDEAELERRRYYNAENNGYDVYPKLFSVAMKLTPSDSYLRKILEMKMHYFRGVSIRLKIPTVKEPLPLIEQALEEQKKALALEETAAYIYNELGVLYGMKKDYAVAENYFKKAGEIAPEWVVPWANLSGLYAATRSFEKGMATVEKAKVISPGLLCIYVNSGFLQEKKGDLLRAEEDYRKSIYLNSRHYSPYERLGHVYLNTTQYALADSFLYEAEVRKKGFHFEPGEFEPGSRLLRLTKNNIKEICPVDSGNISKNDALGAFVLGYYFSEDFAVPSERLLTDRANGKISLDDRAIAEQAFRRSILLDKKHPLAYHYLGKLLYWQERWAEAEILFKLSLENRPDSVSFTRYLDSLSRTFPSSTSRQCLNTIARLAYSEYAAIDEHYFLASLYEKWHHYDEAEKQYRTILNLDPGFIDGYLKFGQMLESIGRYRDAEVMISSFITMNPDQRTIGENELHAFYNRVLAKYPFDAEWNLKAGLFLYRLAADHPDDYPYDWKVVKPDTHEEVFLSEAGKGKNIIYKNPIPGPWKENGFRKGAETIDLPRDEGIACLLKADSLSTWPDEDVAAINEKLGDLYAWQGLPERSIARYQRSLLLQPRNSGVRMKLIDTQDLCFQFHDALAQLDSLDKRREINYTKLLLKARYQMQAGDFTDAGKLLKRAEKLNPLTDMALIDLNGRLMMLSGKPAEAIPLYQNLLDRDPGNSDLQYTLAKLYIRSGNEKEAWKWLTAAVNNGFSYAFLITSDNDWEKFRLQARWKGLTANLDRKDYPLKVSPFKSLFEGY